MLATNPVRVWIRPLGQVCRIRVESVENARWILERLIETNRLVGLEQVHLSSTPSDCTFEIPTSSQRTRLTLENALAQISGAQLMLEPETVLKRALPE